MDVARFLGHYVVLLTLIPTRMVFGPLGALGMPATIFACVGSLCWVLGFFAPETLLVRRSVGVRLALLGMWLATLASFAVLHYHSVLGVEARSADRAVFYLVGWSGVALLASECLATRDDLYRLLRSVVRGAAFVAVVAIFQFYLGLDLTKVLVKIPGLVANGDYTAVLQRSSYRRPSGTATHPIEMACVVSMALPAALHLAQFDVGVTKFKRGAPAVVLAMAIPIAVSRSALLGAGVALVVYLAGSEPQVRLRALAYGALALPFVFMTSPGLLGTLRGLVFGAPTDESITSRTSDYAVVGEMLRRRPFFGRGPDTYLATYRILDNEYLLTLVNTGLLGLVTVFAYLGAIVIVGRGARHRSRNPMDCDLGQALAAAGAVALVSGFVFDSLTFVMFAGFVPLYLGIAGAAWALDPTRAESDVTLASEPPLSATW